MHFCSQHFKYRQEEHTVIFFLHYICSLVGSNPIFQVHSPSNCPTSPIWLLTLKAKPSQESNPKIPLAPNLNGIRNSTKQNRKLIIAKSKICGLNPIKICFLCPHEMSDTEDKKGSILLYSEQKPSGWGRNKGLKPGLGPFPTAIIPKAWMKLREHWMFSRHRQALTHPASPEPGKQHSWGTPRVAAGPSPSAASPSSSASLVASLMRFTSGLAIPANWPVHAQAVWKTWYYILSLSHRENKWS